MNLGFDIDGVISNFAKSLAEVLEKHYNLDVAEADLYCHDLHLVLGISKEERDELIRETMHEDLGLISGSKEALVKLRGEGHRILILTARPKDLINVTKCWLKEKGIPYYRLIHLEVGKKNLAEVDLDLVVEDSLEEAIGWSNKVKNVLVYDQPWNRSFNLKGLFIRVYDWNDVLDEVNRAKDRIDIPHS